MDKIQMAYDKMRHETAANLLKKYLPYGGDVFDFGCGTGQLWTYLPETFHFAGCDTSDEDLQIAQTRTDRGLSHGGIVCLEGEINNFKAIVALNVLPYLSPYQEMQFFIYAKMRLYTGGILLISHTNKWFDLVTFNRFTYDFYLSECLPMLDLPENKVEEIKRSLQALIPKHSEGSSERDILPKRRVDPFTFYQHVQTFGFTLREQVEINTFPLPPIIMEADEMLNLLQLRSHKHYKDQTLKKLQCSQFQMVFTS